MHNIAAAITVVLQAVESSNSSSTSLANKLRSMKTIFRDLLAQMLVL